MSVITIRGELGSGAPEIGKLIAERLHFDYVDREIIADVADRLKRPKEQVEEKEMPPGNLFVRIAEALGRGYALSGGAAGSMAAGSWSYLPTWEIPIFDTNYLAELERVIRELAASGAIVIRGRGSQFILKDYPGGLHVLTVAPLDLRIKRVMSAMDLDEAAARKEIDRFDGSRRQFTKQYFHAELEDPVNYDLVVNTQHIGFEVAASTLVGLLQAKGEVPPE